MVNSGPPGVRPARRKCRSGRVLRRYKAQGFEIIAVSIDEDENELKKQAKERGFTFPMAWRFDDKTDDNFGDVIGTPTLYIVDKNGKIAWTKRGRVTPEQLAAVVEPLLKN